MADATNPSAVTEERGPLTIQGMLDLFGIEGVRLIDSGDWTCRLPDGTRVHVSEDRMSRLAIAFTEWIFEGRR
jgi:hypothetical protein